MSSSNTTPDFELFSSLRYDPVLLISSTNTRLTGAPSPFYMLPYHRDRIHEAAAHFKWHNLLPLLAGDHGFINFGGAIESQIDLTSKSPLRVRVAIDVNGKISVTSGPTPPKRMADLYPTILPSPSTDEHAETEEKASIGNDLPSRDEPWAVLVDTERPEPSSFSTYKTSKRDIYDSARSRAGIASFTEPKEVLLVSVKGEVMEGSLTSIILWRGGRWVTPPAESGGQKGTTRRWLLAEGLVKEEVVEVDSLRDGEECWLSNGVRGMIYGRVKLGDGH